MLVSETDLWQNVPNIYIWKKKKDPTDRPFFFSACVDKQTIYFFGLISNDFYQFTGSSDCHAWVYTCNTFLIMFLFFCVAWPLTLDDLMNKIWLVVSCRRAAKLDLFTPVEAFSSIIFVRKIFLVSSFVYRIITKFSIYACPHRKFIHSGLCNSMIQ